METDEDHEPGPVVIPPDTPTISIRGSSAEPEKEPEPETLEITIPRATWAEYPPRADCIVPAPACTFQAIWDMLLNKTLKSSLLI